MIIVIASGKGGVGKTVSAINLGFAMNELGGKALIVDGNLTTPNVGLHLGAPIVPITLNHVLKGEASLDEAVYEHESGTKILPSSLSIRELNKIKYNKLKGLSNSLRELADNVIIDSPAGLGEEAISVLKMADSIVIVTNPDMPSVTDALKAIKTAQDLGKEVRGVIVARVRGTRAEMPLDNIKDMLEIPVLSVIPDDLAVPESIALKNPVITTKPNSRASKAYKKLAAKLIGKDYMEEKLENKNWLARILENLGF
jgi:septum site-determining protein MinD